MVFAGFLIGSKTTSTGWDLWRDELPPTLLLACVGLLLGWILLGWIFSRKISNKPTTGQIGGSGRGAVELCSTEQPGAAIPTWAFISTRSYLSRTSIDLRMSSLVSISETGLIR